MHAPTWACEEALLHDGSCHHRCQGRKKQGILKNLDESEEINACTVKIKCDVNGKDEDWLFLFKNETHNHPPRSEALQAVRPPASAVPSATRCPAAAMSIRPCVRPAQATRSATVNETLPGKLPQRKLVTTAAAGYSSYGNQIGLATGQWMRSTTPAMWQREWRSALWWVRPPLPMSAASAPPPGMSSSLLGGRTGRGGIGGATILKAHNLSSLDHWGAEVQRRAMRPSSASSSACSAVRMPAR